MYLSKIMFNNLILAHLNEQEKSQEPLGIIIYCETIVINN